MRSIVRLLTLAIAFLTTVPAFAQPRPNPCAAVRCAAPTCPPGQIKTGERQDKCCKVAICKSNPCATVRCAAPTCPSGQIQVGERQEQCCKVAICRPAPPKFCHQFYHKLCQTSADCNPGYRCSRPVAGCQSSSCSCNPQTGAILCTKDCRLGVGKCIR